MEFYLGTHHPHWLKRTDVPLFISRRRLNDLTNFPQAKGPWALDSGGFSELSIHGCWPITPEQYVEFVRRCQGEIGNLRFAAVMDWMCEPIMIHGGKMAGGASAPGTGLSVEEHQKRTVQNVLDLMDLADDIPWVPVLQGWEISDYYRHVDMYVAAGIDLKSFVTVGVGSVCRRGHTTEIEKMMIDLARDGLKLHGFGFKVKGLRKVGPYLESADSMAWSYQARRRDPLPECVEDAAARGRKGHRNCANCIRYALKWRAQTLDSMYEANAEMVPASQKGSDVAEKQTIEAKGELMSRQDVILADADELVQKIGENYYELGQKLYEIEAGAYYKTLGYASFDEYCELRLNFQRTKAKNHIRMWEVLDQHYNIPWESEKKSDAQLKGIPWTNVRVIFPLIAPRGGDLMTKREVKSWLKHARTRPRRELQELVRQAKEGDITTDDGPERRAKPSEVVDADLSEELGQAASTETPYVEDPTASPEGWKPPADDEIDGEALDAADVEHLDPSKAHAEEVDGKDPETGQEVRLMRLSFMLTRPEYQHVAAAMERMSQITGYQHPGKILDLMAGEINQTLADDETGGAAHRLDWYVKNLERIFDVEIEVSVPKNSKLRQMSRVD